MDRPKSLVGIIRGVAGRVESGGALAPRSPRATRNQPEPIQIFKKHIFSNFFRLSLFLFGFESTQLARQVQPDRAQVEMQ